MKKIVRIAFIVIALPLIGSLLIKPAKITNNLTGNNTERNAASKNDISVINSAFKVTVHEEKGDLVKAKILWKGNHNPLLIRNRSI